MLTTLLCLGSHLFIVAIKAPVSNSHFFQSAIISGSTVLYYWNREVFSQGKVLCQRVYSSNYICTYYEADLRSPLAKTKPKLGECTLLVDFLVLTSGFWVPCSACVETVSGWQTRWWNVWRDISNTWDASNFNTFCFCLSICHFRSWLPVTLLVMTSGTTSGHDFRCHFRSWLLVPLPVMISGTTSGHDFRCHFRSWLGYGSYCFRYHFWSWLLTVPCCS